MKELNDIFQKHTAVVFFDVETTGFSPDYDRIIELAALKIEQTEEGALKVAGQMDRLVRLPDKLNIPAKITELTRITDEMLKTEGIPYAWTYRCRLHDEHLYARYGYDAAECGKCYG